MVLVRTTERESERDREGVRERQRETDGDRVCILTGITIKIKPRFL